MNKDKQRKIRSGIEKILGEDKLDVRVIMPDKFLANLSTVLQSQNSEILDLIREQKKIPYLDTLIDENQRTHALLERLEDAIKENKIDRVEIKNFPQPKEVKIPEYPKEIDIKEPSWFEKFSDNRIVGILKDGFNGLAKQLSMDKYMDKKNALAVRLVDKTGKSFYDAVFQAIQGGMPSTMTVAGAVSVTNFPADYPDTTSAGLLTTIEANQLPDGHNVTVNTISGFALESGGNLAAIKTAVEILDNIVAGSEAQVDVLTQPARDRLTDNQGVALQTDAIMADTTALTPKYKAIVATTGDNTLIAASAGFKMRVLALYGTADVAGTVRFESGTGGTALTGQVNVADTGGFVLPFNPVGWFETDDGDDELLNLELTTSGNFDGCLVYVEVPD